MRRRCRSVTSTSIPSFHSFFYFHISFSFFFIHPIFPFSILPSFIHPILPLFSSTSPRFYSLFFLFFFFISLYIFSSIHPSFSLILLLFILLFFILRFFHLFQLPFSTFFFYPFSSPNHHTLPLSIFLSTYLSNPFSYLSYSQKSPIFLFFLSDLPFSSPFHSLLSFECIIYDRHDSNMRLM